MNLGELLDVRSNFNKIVEQKLLEMTCFFQEFMWNGFDDEDDPKFLTKEDFEALEALVGKIEHMTLSIGCPNSVAPMLDSICQRKIKYWQAEDNHETEDTTEYRFDEELKRGKTVVTKRGYGKGRQLRTSSDLSIVANIDGYYHLPREKRIHKGHFRWNNRGYLLSRKATDVLELYLNTKF